MLNTRLVYCVCAILCSFSRWTHGQSKIAIAEEKLKKADAILHELIEWLSKKNDLESFERTTPEEPYNKNAIIDTPKEPYDKNAIVDTPKEPYDKNVIVTTTKDVSNLPIDCTEIKQKGITNSGVYEVRPVGRTTDPVNFKVFCDMKTDGGGWTVFQRRGDFGHPKDYFFRNWYNYSVGFGNAHEDFWLGNDKIHSLTSQGKYTLRIDMKDKEGNSRYAKYQGFSIGNEKEQYQLHISTYSGDAGDSLTKHHNNRKFSTFDRDNDDASTEHCSNRYKGAWWYDNCYDSSLNGLYLNGPHESYADGVEWYHWKGLRYSLPDVEMKIRRN